VCARARVRVCARESARKKAERERARESERASEGESLPRWHLCRHYVCQSHALARAELLLRLHHAPGQFAQLTSTSPLHSVTLPFDIRICGPPRQSRADGSHGPSCEKKKSLTSITELMAALLALSWLTLQVWGSKRSRHADGHYARGAAVSAMGGPSSAPAAGPAGVFCLQTLGGRGGGWQHH
jgi:hypothetical protein